MTYSARTIQTAPTVEPVSLEELKAHLRVDIDDDDALITSIGKAARQQAEVYTGRAFCTQTWDLFLDSWPTVIYLPYPPLSSVTSITYTDTAGDSQTVSTSVYTVDTDSEPGRIYLAYGQTWPTTRGIRHAITVRYVCGYGAAAAVPENVKHAIKIMAADMYENREEVVTGTTVNRIPILRSLLSALCVVEVE